MECGYSAELQALKRNQRRRSDADECNRDLFFSCAERKREGEGGSCGQMWALGFEGMNESLSYLTEMPRGGGESGGAEMEGETNHHKGHN